LSKVLSCSLTVLLDDQAGYGVRGLLGQHGLSVLVNVVDASGRSHSLLFDTGQSSKPILHNLELLEASLKSVNVIAISHRHYDHSGGLLGLARALRKGVRVITHPDFFKPCIRVRDDGSRLDIGVPYSQEELERLGITVMFAKNVVEVAPGVFFLGEIPRKSFETSPKGMYTFENGEMIPDPLADDTALAIQVENLGIVVVAGCSHSGIVNILSYVQELFGSEIYAVLGGLHLLSRSEEYIRRVIEEMRKIGVREVHVGHCTGFEAECMLLQEFGSRFKRIYSGYRVTFKSN